jgi:hypothetical protein
VISPEDAKKIVLSTNNIAMAFLDSVTVGVVCFKNQKPDKIGSGTCIKLGDEHFIATARHVIEGYPKTHISFVYGGEGRLHSNWLQIEDRGWDNDERLDIGWIKVSKEVADLTNKTFVSNESLVMSKTHYESGKVLVFGYPIEFVDKGKLGESVLATRSYFYNTITVAQTEWKPIEADPNVHMVLSYSEQAYTFHTDKIEAVPDPKGISGGGVWHLNMNKGKIWSPTEMKMIGVENAWFSKSRQLRATKMQFWQRMIGNRKKDQ